MDHNSMTLARILCCYVVLTTLSSTQLGFAMRNEKLQISESTVNKTTPLTVSPKVKVKVFTNFKQEIIDLKSNLTKFMTNELARQKDELKRLLEAMKANEVFIRNELEALQQKNKENLAIENQKLSMEITEKLSNQMEAQQQLFKQSFSAIAPPRVNSDQMDSNFNCTQHCGPVMDLPNNCDEAMPTIYHKNGVYLMNGTETGHKPYYSYCKRIDNKVWTVIQRRGGNVVDFNRDWMDYKLGFGDLYGEFWLGLERVHAITMKQKHALGIWLESSDGNRAYAQYEHFWLGSEDEKYKLTVENYRGTAGDSLTPHSQKKFSTRDMCNDGHCFDESCAVFYKGGWWFDGCYNSHLNGHNNNLRQPTHGVDWNGFSKLLKYTQMAIRPV